MLALLCSGVAWASLPKPQDMHADEQVQWQALAIAPLSSGGETGLRMDATDEVEPIAVVPERRSVACLAHQPGPEQPDPQTLNIAHGARVPS